MIQRGDLRRICITVLTPEQFHYNLCVIKGKGVSNSVRTGYFRHVDQYLIFEEDRFKWSSHGQILANNAATAFLANNREVHVPNGSKLRRTRISLPAHGPLLRGPLSDRTGHTCCHIKWRLDSRSTRESVTDLKHTSGKLPRISAAQVQHRAKCRSTSTPGFVNMKESNEILNIKSTCLLTWNRFHVNGFMLHAERTHPVSDVEETLLVCEVKQKEEPHRVSEERRRQTAKPDTIQTKKTTGKKG